MKALTIWQPWAAALAAGIKVYETRSWPTKYRGTLAIHAASKSFHVCWNRFTKDAARETICRRLELPTDFDSEANFPLGCVLATAELVDCVEITPEFAATLSSDELALGDYTPGRYAWKLVNVKKFANPVPVRGWQGLWNWEPEEPHSEEVQE